MDLLLVYSLRPTPVNSGNKKSNAFQRLCHSPQAHRSGPAGAKRRNPLVIRLASDDRYLIVLSKTKAIPVCALICEFVYNRADITYQVGDFNGKTPVHRASKEVPLERIFRKLMGRKMTLAEQFLVQRKARFANLESSYPASTRAGKKAA